jgi:hypothetical protein
LKKKPHKTGVYSFYVTLYIDYRYTYRAEVFLIGQTPVTYYTYIILAMRNIFILDTQEVCSPCLLTARFVGLSGLRGFIVVVLTPFSKIFKLYRGGQFCWWRKPEYPEKTTDLSQVN